MIAHFQKFLAVLWVGVCVVWVSLSAGHLHPAWIVAGVSGILFAYAGVLLLEFGALYRQHRDDPIHPVNFQLLARAWLAESWIAARVFLWDQAFRSQSLPDVLANAAGQRAVLLIHGYLCNRGFWNPWMRQLRLLRIPYCAITIEPVFDSIDGAADAIDAAVREVT